MRNGSPWNGYRTVFERIAWAGTIALLVTCSLLLPVGAFAHGDEDQVGSKPAGSVAAESAKATEIVPRTAGHDHAEPPAEAIEASSGHPYPPAGVPRPLAWLGKFHPALTHFPIALLSVAALAELLLLRRPSELLRHAVRFSVWAGAIGALIAAPLGWLFAGFRIVDDEWVMTAHRWLGTGVALWALVLLRQCERAYRPVASRIFFRFTLFVGAASVGCVGFLGGSLIYGLDHYAW